MNKALWRIDKQGNLVFTQREEQMMANYAADSGWEHPVAAFIVMLICALADFAVFKQLFAAILYDRLLIQWLSVIACLVAFELSPIYLGILTKKSSQGIRVNKVAVVGLVVAFILVMTGNVWLRLTVMDILVPNDSVSTFSIFKSMGETAEHSTAAFPYAVFSSVLPFATSLVSFIVSYMASNPLKSRLKRLQEQQVGLEAAAAMIEAVLMEYSEDPDLRGRLTAEDDAKYTHMLAMTQERGYMHADYVRERIKEHLGEAAATNELSKDCRSRLGELFAAPSTEKKGFPFEGKNIEGSKEVA